MVIIQAVAMQLNVMVLYHASKVVRPYADGVSALMMADVI